jgi:hypothetical protein
LPRLDNKGVYNLTPGQFVISQPSLQPTVSIAQDTITKQILLMESSQSGPTMANTTLGTLFKELPPELRDEIWMLTLAPRTVELTGNSIRVEECTFFASPAPLPSALKVCRESRRSVLQFYSRIPGTRIRFYYSIDTIYFGEWFLRVPRGFSRLCAKRWMANVRYIGLAKRSWEFDERSLGPDIQKLVGVREVVIVCTVLPGAYPEPAEPQLNSITLLDDIQGKITVVGRNHDSETLDYLYWRTHPSEGNVEKNVRKWTSASVRVMWGWMGPLTVHYDDCLVRGFSHERDCQDCPRVFDSKPDPHERKIKPPRIQRTGPKILGSKEQIFESMQRKATTRAVKASQKKLAWDRTPKAMLERHKGR